MDTIAANLEQVNERIQTACDKAGRDPEEITLVAVSKTKPTSDILEALDCGQLHFGENRPKELQQKMEELNDHNDIIWHMIGPLQTNSIKYMTDRVNWIESIPKQKSLREIEKRASRIDRVIDTLIQVNISGENQKQGCEADDLAEILEYAAGLEHVRVRGLMGIATFADDPEDVRPEFANLRNQLEKHKKYESDNVKMEHLSMGMTHDLEVAIEEGATIVRVGSAIFGPRNYN